MRPIVNIEQGEAYLTSLIGQQVCLRYQISKTSSLTIIGKLANFDGEEEGTIWHVSMAGTSGGMCMSFTSNNIEAIEFLTPTFEKPYAARIWAIVA